MEEALSEGWIARCLNLVERLGDEFLRGNDGYDVYLELEKVLGELNLEELKTAFKTLAGKYIAERNTRIYLRTLADQILQKEEEKDNETTS